MDFISSNMHILISNTFMYPSEIDILKCFLCMCNFSFVFDNRAKSECKIQSYALYIIIIKLHCSKVFPRLSLSLHPSLSFIALSRSSELHLVSAQSCYWHVLAGHVSEFVEECHLWVRPCFSSSAPHVLFASLGWFQWWKVDGHTSVVTWDVASRICSI